MNPEEKFAQRLSELSPEKRRLFEQLMKSQGAAAAAPAIQHRPAEGPSPLSFGQQRLWFMHQLEPDSIAHNLPVVKRLTGTLDTAALQRALSELVSRHHVLRTKYVTIEGVPHQVVCPAEPFPLLIEDLSALAPEARATEMRRLIAAVTAERFDLTAGRPLRARLLKLGDADHLLLVAIHHIVYDLWSAGVFWSELTALLTAFTAGQPSPLPPLPIQYYDFARWQRETITEGALASDLAYWTAQLNGAPSVLTLPGDRPRPPLVTGRGGMDWLAIPADVTARLRAIARGEQATMFMILVAAFHTVLHWYSGADDILLGSPIGNRKPAETEGLIGIFLNNLVLRGDLSGDPAFTELLARERKTVLDAFAHSDLPFERLVEELQPQRALNVHPLFQVLFTLMSATRRDAVVPAAAVDTTPTVSVAMDLEAYFDDAGDTISGLLKYSTDLFDAATIARMRDQLRNLLAAVAMNPSLRLSELRLLAQARERDVREAWNDTARAFPRQQCVHDLIAEAAARQPQKPAIEAGDSSLSYAALTDGAARVAAGLRRAGIRPGDRVGVFMDRSSALLPALVGVMQAGAAYVPLDPAFPNERLAYMLADSNAAAVIADRSLRGVMPPARAQVLEIETLLADSAPAGPVAVPVTPEDVAYVIYTSGSTGRPKGVQVPHRAVVNFLTTMRESPGLSPADRLLAVTTLSFDIAGLELFLPLTTGATVILARREDAADPLRLRALLEGSRATVMQATPATWRMLIDGGWRGSSSLRILCGGEALPDDLARGMCERAEEVWNVYGPTETTIWSTIERVSPGRALTIGRPIANTRLHILDRGLLPVPIGAAGEICIGGDGVARGYLDRPELTAERFVPDPSGVPGARMYRTGDLGRFLADGRIEYLGRIDHQVKLRGFRIELGEIESVLAQHPSVNQAVARVRVDGPGDARLVAYIVEEPGAQGTIDKLKQLVTSRLPQYMHPSAYVVLPALPLTPNGKVDRAALPAPERPAVDRQALQPRSGLEATIAAVWMDVLRVDTVGVQDNFFDLGGHSLLLVQVQSKLAAAIGRAVPILELFQFPTIAALARHLGGDVSESRFAVEAAARANRTTPAGSAAVAIVGLAGRFPGSGDVEAFWQNLRDGVEGIRFFTDEELRAAGVPDDLLQEPDFVRARGALDGADLFDAALFGFTPREADLMDPQHRVFLEGAWEALERAGYDPQRYPGLIGVFAGSSLSAYFMNALAQGATGLNSGDVDLLLNGDKDHMPTRVSYKLNLRGPSLNIQTACSTSLVAVHLACRSLLANECDMALAGGVSVGVSQVGGYLHVEGGIGSPDGHCRAFDAASGGTVGGSGLGIVVLKRLADAVAAGDHIHAVILGTAINNDGSSKVGYTAPSIEGESRAIALAQAVAGCAGDTIGYVEAHGTGTKLGDPIEVKALTQVFREATPARQYCAIGSVKSNIGHLDAASGVAGLMKAALALEHAEIPPSLHYESPNPEIDFEASPFFVNTTLRPWMSGPGQPRRAAVSSFGLGGTNAHAVLEEAPAAEPSGPSREWQILPLSARTEAALDNLSGRIARHLSDHPDASFADGAFTLALGRQQLDHRRVVVARSAADAAALLDARTGARVATGRAPRAPRVAFVFPGQGAQYAGMGADLYSAEGAFRQAVDGCADGFRRELGLDVRDALYRARDVESALDDTVVTQAALFATEYGLARLWMSWGVIPDAMIGHSLGEYVAAVVSGVLSLDDAIRLIACRATAMAAAPPGGMLAVAMCAEDARAAIGENVSLAAINGPLQCVLSGERDALERLDARLTAENVETKWLSTAGAFHSALMDGVLGPLREAASRITAKAPRIPYVSNVTGQWISAGDVADPEYWTRHVRGTVEFRGGAQALLDSGCDVFLEVGPGPTLGGLVRHTAAESNRAVTILASLGRAGARTTAGEQTAWALANVWLAGARVDWEAYYAGQRRRRVVLPTYPFERKRHWFSTTVRPQSQARHQPTGKLADVGDWFYAPSWKSTLPVEHVHERRPLPEHWLVLSDRDATREVLAARLRRDGRTVTCVRSGDRFLRSGADDYTIDPARSEHAAQLVEDLHARERGPQAVVHCWSAETEAGWDSPGLVERVTGRGFYSVLYLTQALAARTSPVTLAVLTSGAEVVSGGEPAAPLQATVRGLCRVIPQEYEHIVAGSIDIDRPGEVPLDRVIAEVACGLPEAATAIRGRTRWTRSFERVPLRRPEPGAIPVREGGVYLITGGIGRVGFDFAEYLARVPGVRIALTRRSPFPEPAEWDAWVAKHGEGDRTSRHIQRIRRIESLGARVLVRSADVSDEPAMRGVLADITKALGPVTGVIHAAGVLTAAALRPIAELDRETCDPQFSAKVDGLIVLDRLLAGATLDFRILMSSLSAVLGGLNYSAYASANAFLDAFAEGSGSEWTSVAWDAWRAPAGEDPAVSATARFGMTSGEGVEALERVLGAAGVPALVVSTGDLPTRLAEWSGRAAAGGPHDGDGAAQDSDRSRLDSAYVAPGNDVEVAIAEIWSELFGIPRIGVHDDFFSLGGHSLLAIRLMSRVRQALQIDVPLEALFQAPTIAGLADAVLERFLESGADDPLLGEAEEVSGNATPGQSHDRPTT